MRLTGSVAGFGRRAVAMALVGAMLAPSAAFAGGRPRRVGNGPDSAATLAQWSRVQQVPLSEDIYLATDTAIDRVMLLAADEAEIVVLMSDATALPARVVRALRAVATEHPRYLAYPDAARTITHDDVQIGPSGLFMKGERLGDVSDVVRHVPREQVRWVQAKMAVRGNSALAVAGLVAGLIVGRVALGHMGPGRSLGGDLAATLGVLAASGAAGAGTFGMVGTHLETGVVYQRLDTPSPAVR